MKVPPVLVLCFALQFAAAVEATVPPAEQILSDAIAHPGNYDQICDVAPPLGAKIPMPLYHTLLDRELHVSSAKMESLRARRAETVVALAVMIDQIQPTESVPVVPPLKVLERPEGDPERVQQSGVSPKQISGLLMEIIVGLRAVETIPNLLTLEERLRAGIEKADSDQKAPPPTVANDGFVSSSGRNKLSKRELQLASARIAQRELLSIILQLLRQQKYPPLLHSEYERAYEKDIKARVAANPKAKEIKNPEDAKAKGMEGVPFDPIYNVPVLWTAKKPVIPFSAKVREDVRRMATEFMASVPKEQWILAEP